MLVVRATAILSLAMTAVLGCAGAKPGAVEARGDSRGLDYCDCEMWGVMGPEPEPGYQKPPRPPACERILKRTPARDCPVPQ